MNGTTEHTEASARAASCWFDVDRVPRDPATTAWKRLARFRQSCWREARGYPMGAQPYSGGFGATSVGSRLALEFAKATGANFVTTQALEAVRRRLATPEPHQMLSADRLWADLLSSMPLCFNFFGDLEGDAVTAARCLRAWWPDVPQGDVTVRFEHSPGRRDRAFLGNQSAFDVAFEVDVSGSSAIVGVETKYHEHARAEAAPRPAALSRYVEVTERSGVFADGWQKQLIGTDLQQIWLDHLLVLAMLQHPSKRWQWGRFVLVFPEENLSFASASARYSEVLSDHSTFEARTLSELIAAPGAMPEATRGAFAERYLAPPSSTACNRRVARPLDAPAHCAACDGAADFDDINLTGSPLVFDEDGNIVSGGTTVTVADEDVLARQTRFRK